MTLIRDPLTDNELSNRKNIDDELSKNTILRFNHLMQKYLEVTVGNTDYILELYVGYQKTDTTKKNIRITADISYKYGI